MQQQLIAISSCYPYSNSPTQARSFLNPMLWKKYAIPHFTESCKSWPFQCNNEFKIHNLWVCILKFVISVGSWLSTQSIGLQWTLPTVWAAFTASWAIALTTSSDADCQPGQTGSQPSELQWQWENSWEPVCLGLAWPGLVCSGWAPFQRVSHSVSQGNTIPS